MDSIEIVVVDVESNSFFESHRRNMKRKFDLR